MYIHKYMYIHSIQTYAHAVCTHIYMYYAFAVTRVVAYMHEHTHVHTHTHTHTHAHTHTCTHTRTHTHPQTHTHKHTCTYTLTHTHPHTHNTYQHLRTRGCYNTDVIRVNGLYLVVELLSLNVCCVSSLCNFKFILFSNIFSLSFSGSCPPLHF